VFEGKERGGKNCCLPSFVPSLLLDASHHTFGSADR
jgi:hypothetical protein